MKISGYKRFRSEDFPKDYKDLIDKLSFSVNNGIEILYEALNKKVDFDNNIKSTIKDIDVIVNSQGNLVTPIIVKTDFTGTPRGLILLKADNLTNTSIYPTTSPWISWNLASTGVQFTNITGLQANNTYRLRVLIIG